MILYYDPRFETVLFGMKQLKQSLDRKSIFHVDRPLNSYIACVNTRAIVASLSELRIVTPSAELEPGGFEIRLEGLTL